MTTDTPKNNSTYIDEKYDDGKTLASLPHDYFPRALELVAKVATMGAKKYSKGGWIHVQNGKERYYDAFYRHMTKYNKDNNSLDEESNFNHLGHAAWNLLACLEFMLRENDVNLKIANLKQPISNSIPKPIPTSTNPSISLDPGNLLRQANGLAIQSKSKSKSKSKSRIGYDKYTPIDKRYWNKQIVKSK